MSFKVAPESAYYKKSPKYKGINSENEVYFNDKANGIKRLF
jgi:hypothetical protein